MGDDREWRCDDTPAWQRAGRAVYIEVNLDHIVHNIQLMKACCKNPAVGESFNIKTSCR